MKLLRLFENMCDSISLYIYMNVYVCVSTSQTMVVSDLIKVPYFFYRAFSLLTLGAFSLKE